MLFNDRRTRPVESKKVGRLRSIVTGEKVGSYTAPKNVAFSSTNTPSDYRVEKYQAKRGNTYKGQLPTDRPVEKKTRKQRRQEKTYAEWQARQKGK